MRAVNCRVTRYLLVLLIIHLLVFVISEIAFADTYPDKLKKEAVKNKLHKDNGWLALLYYKKKKFINVYRSQADEQSFFLSPDGANNPEAELLATIKKMFLSESLDNEHPQCIFPARFSWLRKKLNIDITQLPAPSCNNLYDWKKKINNNQVTIIFPAAYLNNPSSMFGHIFLRFDPSDITDSNLLMANTINFAADTAAQKGVADYFFRGLFGGFPSVNSMLPFYRRFKRYSDIENRDIWEYTLNFSPEEIEQLVLHVWELKKNIFDYYFFDENCAYRLLALLEVARPNLRLVEKFSMYTIPADVIRGLRERGAIQSYNYRPSAVKLFYHHSKYLKKDENKIVIDIVHNNLPLNSLKILSLSTKRRTVVLAMASEYLNILINKDIIDRNMSSKLARQLLVERISYSLPVQFPDMPSLPNSPDKGHKTHRISLGGGFNTDNGFFLIKYRDVYHGLLDPLPGFEKGSQVELLSIELRGYKGYDIQLEQLDIINLTSLTPSTNYFRAPSWKFSIGREKKKYNSKESTVNDIECGIGMTFEMAGYMLTGLLNFSLDMGKSRDYGFGVGTGGSIAIVYQNEKYSFDLGAVSIKYFAGDTDSLTKLWGKISYTLTTDNALFLQMSRSPNNNKNSNEINFGLHHYF